MVRQEPGPARPGPARPGPASAAVQAALWQVRLTGGARASGSHRFDVPNPKRCAEGQTKRSA